MQAATTEFKNNNGYESQEKSTEQTVEITDKTLVNTHDPLIAQSISQTSERSNNKTPTEEQSMNTAITPFKTEREYNSLKSMPTHSASILDVKIQEANNPHNISSAAEYQVRQKCLKEDTPESRGSDAKTATQKDIMGEIKLKHAYLEANWLKNHGDQAETWGVRDFQDVRHNNPYFYLLALGKDPDVYHKIDYSSDIGQKMRSALSRHFKCYIPHGGMPALNRLQQIIKGNMPKDIEPSSLTADEIMSEITKNHHFLKDWGNHDNDKSWGINDFQGVRHNRPYEYLVAVATDPSVLEKIDYNSDVGKQIRKDLSRALKCKLPERCLPEVWDIQKETGRNIIHEQQVLRENSRGYSR